MEEYLLLSAPHGNDGVRLRRRKNYSPQSHRDHRVFICFAHRPFWRWAKHKLP